MDKRQNVSSSVSSYFVVPALEIAISGKIHPE